MTDHHGTRSGLWAVVGWCAAVALVGAMAPFAATGAATVASPVPAAVGAVQPADTGSASDDSAASASVRCGGGGSDQQQVEQGLAQAKGGVLTISGTCSVAGPLDLQGPVTLRGKDNSAGLTTPGSLFTVSGNKVRLERLRLTHEGSGGGVMITLTGSSGFTMDRVLLDGGKQQAGGAEVHGISIAPTSGQVSGARIVDSTIRRLDYGLLQDSAVQAPTDGFLVTRSLFSDNAMDDLEFNAPAGKMTNIAVTYSRFQNNRADNPEAPFGFGVGMANVQHATIGHNDFTGYRFNPVHLEDRSSGILVERNRFWKASTAATSFASHVVMLNSVTNVDVVGNLFDTTANTDTVVPVYAGSGGGTGPVTDVRLQSNTFVLGSSTSDTIGRNDSQGVSEKGSSVRRT